MHEKPDDEIFFTSYILLSIFLFNIHILTQLLVLIYKLGNRALLISNKNKDLELDLKI